MEQKPIDRAIAKQQLARINAVLRKPHLLIGGLAVQQYYPARVSNDIDLVCEFETGQLLLDTLYPSRDWKIIDKHNDEYRPSFQITHKIDDLGMIVFGPKISERKPYQHIDWNRLMRGGLPFAGLSGDLENIIVPTAHALAYTKFISFLGRHAPDEKIRQDLKDLIDLTNCEEFSVSLFFDFLRMSKAFEILAKDFRTKVNLYQDILAESSLSGLACIFISSKDIKELTSVVQGDASATGSIPRPVQLDEHKHIHVSTAEEFLNAIGPNRTIEITAPRIDLGEVPDRFMKYVRWDPVFDGRTITLRNISGLVIRGAGIARTRLVVSPRYSFVLGFDGCSGVTIQGVTFGHEPEGYCTGGVLAFSNTREIMIEDCSMFGSGTEGLNLQAVEGLTMKDCDLYHCTYGIMTIKSSRRILFVETDFRNNAEFYGVEIRDSEDVEFTSCRFRGNIVRGALFEVISSSKIKLVRGVVTDNRCTELGNIETEDVDVQPSFEAFIGEVGVRIKS